MRAASLLTFLVAVATPAVAQAPDATRRELIAFADRFDAAQIAQDKAALETMVADDLVFIDGTGKRLGKAAFIAGWTDPDTRYSPVTIADRTVTLLGPHAGIVSGETVVRGQAAGKAFAAHIRFADAFRRIGGRWQAVHIQVTRIP